MADPDPLTFRPETAVILDSITDGVFTVDPEFRITSFNRAAEQITGVSKEEALGRACREVFQADVCDDACPLRRTMETGEPEQLKPTRIVRPDGRKVSLSLSAAQLHDASGRIIGGVETFRDLSAVEELRRKLTRSHEYHHIVSKSRRMQRIFDVLPSIAASESNVLLQGPSAGTGHQQDHALAQDEALRDRRAELSRVPPTATPRPACARTRGSSSTHRARVGPEPPLPARDTECTSRA